MNLLDASESLSITFSDMGVSYVDNKWPKSSPGFNKIAFTLAPEIFTPLCSIFVFKCKVSPIICIDLSE